MITRRRYNALPYIYNFSIESYLVPVDPEYIYASNISEGNPVTATGIIIGYLTMVYVKYTVQELNETLKLTYESLVDDGSVLTPSKIKKIYFTDEMAQAPGKYPLRIDFDVYSSYFDFWDENSEITIQFDDDGFNDINTSISIGDHYMPPSLYLQELTGQIVLPFYDSDITITKATEPSDNMSYHTETINAEFYKYEDDIYIIPEYEMKTVSFESRYTYIYVDSILIDGSGHIGTANRNVNFSVDVGTNSVYVDCQTILFGYNGSVPNISVTIGYYSFN